MSADQNTLRAENGSRFVSGESKARMVSRCRIVIGTFRSAAVWKDTQAEIDVGPEESVKQRARKRGAGIKPGLLI